jgi:hypothetical protein
MASFCHTDGQALGWMTLGQSHHDLAVAPAPDCGLFSSLFISIANCQTLMTG